MGQAINDGHGDFFYFSDGWMTGSTAHIMDFNGDTRSDVFLHKTSTGEWAKCLSIGDGTADFSCTAGAWYPGWQVHAADFDADKQSDMFLYHPPTGEWYRVITRANYFVYHHGAWDPDWSVSIVDLNGDGQSDALLYHPVTGRVASASSIPSQSRLQGPFDWVGPFD